MKGKTFGFGDANSTSGSLIPSIEIPQAASATMQSGDFFGGVTRADGLGEWEDGSRTGALRRAVDAGLVDMNDLVEIWKSKPIPEGPVMLRKALPADVKEKMTALMEGLSEKDRDCFYGVAAGEARSFDPIGHAAYHAAYEGIIEARKLKSE